MATLTKSRKRITNRENVVVVDFGEVLASKLRKMATHNGITLSQAARLLLAKAFDSSDRTIVYTIPD